MTSKLEGPASKSSLHKLSPPLCLVNPLWIAAFSSPMSEECHFIYVYRFPLQLQNTILTRVPNFLRWFSAVTTANR
jgi:hypothetical protein